MTIHFRSLFLRFLQPSTLFAFVALAGSALAEEEIQYEHKEITVVGASADEPILEQMSVTKALDYLEAGATAWTKERNCISCHTNGSYLLLRPALTSALGKPSQEIRDFYLTQLEKREAADPEELKTKGVTPSELAYLAGGLAEWDAHVSGKLSDETTRALTLMFKVQADDGSYANETCWPPLESSDYLSATVAAMAAATAPGYLDSIDDQSKAAYDKLISYIKETEPAHDYARLMLLRTASRVDGLIENEVAQDIVQMVFDHQREDGGWSIRTFAAADAWGGGNREDKLLEEGDYENPPSDGYLTGLAIVVLRDFGVAADDPRIQKGVEWIKKNQRESGRWWTRSLNNDKFHFITFSGTCYPLLALASTNAIPALASE